MPHELPTGGARTLPLRVQITAGESLESFVEALAARNGVTVRQLLPVLGLTVPRTPRGLLVDLDPQILRRIEGQTGLPTGRLDAAVLDRYVTLDLATRPVRGLPPSRWQRWARASGARYCPQCLAETNGRWRLAWSLSWAFACVDHGALLAAACPRCGGIPRTGENRWDQVPGAALCWQKDREATAATRTRPRCGADLTSARTQHLPAEHPVLRAQREINMMLALDGPGPLPETVVLVGLYVPLDVALDGISALMRQAAARLADLPNVPIRFLAPRRRLGRGLVVDGPGRGQSMPARLSRLESPVSFGLAATAALDCLSAPTLDRAVEAADWLLPDLSRQLGDIDQSELVPWGQGPEDRGAPLYNMLVLRHRTPVMRISSRLSFRTSNPIPRWPSTSIDPSNSSYTWPHLTGHLHQVPARLVPHRLWPSVIAVLPRPTRKDTPAFPAAMSIAIVRIGSFLSWRKIAIGLALPDHLASTVRAVWARIERAGHTATVLAMLDRLADALMAQPPPIDYARRRRLFRDLEEVDEGRFNAACRRSGLVATTRRRRYATMWLWERLTGGDVRLHPGRLTPNDPADRTAYAAFHGHEAVDLVHYLDEEAERLLLRDRLDEPISWQPEPGGGPDGAGWRCPPPDLQRRLPGWVSPERLPETGTAGAQYDALWREVLEDPYDDRLLETLVYVLPKFLLGEPRPRPSGNDLIRSARAHGEEWSGLRRIRHFETRFRVPLVEPDSEDQDATYSLTAAGQNITNELLHTCRSQITEGTSDPWNELVPAGLPASSKIDPTRASIDALSAWRSA